MTAFSKAFHGRTYATMAATGQERFQDGFAPIPDGFKTVPWGDLNVLEAAITPKTAAVLVEIVQGEGGIRPMHAEYAKGIEALCREKGLVYMGTAQIVMPENFIAMFNAPTVEEARRIVAKAEPFIDRAIAAIRAGHMFSPPRKKLYDRIASSAVNPVFYPLFVKANSFTASDVCIGCGKCEKLCPLNNITLQNARPVWGSNCTQCMACICYCPTRAIEYGKKSAGKPRYHFEEL